MADTAISEPRGNRRGRTSLDLSNVVEPVRAELSNFRRSC